ncbi:MAG: extracellular solute-binding protein [Ardenticatenaceae bacterium]|nr:extracellular solute-binding protein [Ardenticatenaceae bacterium]
MKRQLTFLILLFCLTACNDKEVVDQVNSQATENTTDVSTGVVNWVEEQITLQFAVDDFSVSRYDALIDSFEQENPHIIIQVKSVSDIVAGLEPDEAVRRIAQTSDVFDGRTLFGANWQQLALDLTPFIETTPTFNREDFPANLLEETDGSIRLLPVSLNPVLLAYNKTLFAQASLETPRPGWTWEQFHMAANTLTIRNNEETTQWGLVHAFPGSLSFYTAPLDGWLVDWKMSPPRPRFDDPELINAVRQHTDLYLIDKVGPDGSTTTAYNEAERLIAEEHAAMWPVFYTELGRYAEMQDIGVVPLPTSKQPETTMVYVNGFAISAGTSHPQAAWEWINFLTHQLPVAEGIPARTTTREADRSWQNTDTQIREAVMYGLAYSFKYYFHPVNKTFIDAVTDILIGNKAVEETLAEAQRAAANMSTGGESVETITVEMNEEKAVADEVIRVIFIPHLTSDTQPYRLAARQFEQNHPHIQIDVREASLDLIPNIDRGGEKGDCFQWSATLAYSQEERENLLSLDAFVQADSALDLKEFYTPLVEALIVQGELWALPADVTPLIIEYNKDLFDVAGIPYPQMGWTTSEFLEMATALSMGEGNTKQYGFVPEVVEAATIAPMLSSHGARLLDTSTNPATFAFTAPGTVAAVRWYTDLSRTYGVKPAFIMGNAESLEPGSGVIFYFDERRRLIQGELAAMWSRWSNNDYGHLQADTEGLTNLGAVPLPLNPGAQSTISSEMAYFIAADTQHRQACWQWLTFITTIDASVGMPARISLAESAAYRRRVGAEIAAAQIAAVKQMEQLDPLVAQVQWMAPGTVWFYRALAQIVNEVMPVEAALDSAQDTFDAYRNCIIDNSAYQDIQLQARCARDVDATFPGNFSFTR